MRPRGIAQALQSALDRLFDRERNLVRLFDPPFERAVPDPGYLRSYGPGFRENGGQYTHGALWLAMALLREGRADDGWAILRAVLPAAHDPEVYEAEPYVLAADVCTRDGAERAGWTSQSVIQRLSLTAPPFCLISITSNIVSSRLSRSLTFTN